MKEFCTKKFFDVKAENGEKLRTVFFSPNNIETFNWICFRYGVKKYRQARLWELYSFLQYGDYIGVDADSIKLIRLKLHYEYRTYSDYVIEDDLRLLANMGLIVESKTNEKPNIDAFKEIDELNFHYWKMKAMEKNTNDAANSNPT